MATVAVKPDGWWHDRRASAYAALKAGKPNLAYDLVRDPGSLSDNAGKDAAFLAGWLALRHLRDANWRPLPDIGRYGRRPLSRARGYYWLGRTHQALGDTAKAQAAFPRGLGLHRHVPRPTVAAGAHPEASSLKLQQPPATPTTEEIARFDNLDAVRGHGHRPQGRSRFRWCALSSITCVTTRPVKPRWRCWRIWRNRWAIS